MEHMTKKALIEMTTNKRIENFDYEWVPRHEKFSDLPPSTFRSEDRMPVLLLVTGAGESMWETNVYILNYSAEIMNEVSRDFESSEQTKTLDEEAKFVYKNVQPMEAVLVDVLDTLYDFDFGIEHELSIKSAAMGHLRLFVRSHGKRRVTEGTVLVWNTKEPGPDVDIIEG